MTVNRTARRKARLRFAVACAATLSFVRPGVAADADTGTATVQTTPAIEPLLRTIEQRISANHTALPVGESAIDAWKQVIQVIPATDPVRVGTALTTFAIHMRRRAGDEKKAGNVTVSEDMSVFASQADALKATIVNTATGGPRQSMANQPLPASPKFEPLAGSLPPVAPPPPRPAETPSVAEFYAWRGDLMLARKDIPAARKYYELAAGAGSARAAVQLARINDPAFVNQSHPEPAAKSPAPDSRRRHRARPLHEAAKEPSAVPSLY